MENLMALLIQIAVLVFAVIIHEVSHGYVAYKLGDPTAKYSGRLTLNPLAHIDPFMSILLPGFMIATGMPFIIGGAKPVPINPNYFTNHKRDVMLVSAAGPFSNILLAIIGILLLKIAAMFDFLKTPGLLLLLQYTIIINVVLAAFNLIPIPPLDGSKILMGFLPDEAAYNYSKLEPYGIFIILILMGLGILQIFLMPMFIILEKLIRLIM
jgi:Zn-dependent protease